MKMSLIVMVILCYACSPARQSALHYYYVEPFKEHDLKLVLKDDHTFSLRDQSGCNQFEYTGRYKKTNDPAISYFVFDSVQHRLLLSNGDPARVFSINNGDTAWILNKDRLFIHHEPFIATTKANVNLQEIRYRKLEEYYIGLLGRDGFIKTFGNNKSMKQAKKRLLECSLPDLKLVLPD